MVMRAASVLAMVTVVVALAARPAQGARPRSWHKCSKRLTKAVADEAGVPDVLNRDATLRRAFKPQKPSTIYRYVNDALCGDFDGDGDRDRAILFDRYTGGSYGPWFVLRRSGSKWRITYKRLHDITFSMTGGQDLKTVVPVYSRNDANCCPSRIRIGTLHWTGRSFT